MQRDSPYVGLDAFSEEDAAYFFGRKRDVALIVANVFASPLTVLYGPSGAGKTSVLRAGVVPSLREREIATTVLDSWAGDPAAALRASVPDVATAAEGAPASARREVLVLDAFEDFFHDSDEAAFAAELARVVSRPGRTSSVLLAIREDALAKLDRFEGRVPGLLDNVLRLDQLDRDAGREAILGPRDSWNAAARTSERFEVEDELVDAVLDGVTTERGRVDTLLLQLVMTRLWEARGPSPHVLRREALEALGGVDGIVEDYVTGKLEALDPARQAQAAEILEHLVTPSRLRIAQRASDLAGFAGVAESELEPLLEELSESSILRPVAGSDAFDSRYEVRHDSLADAVLAWRTHYVTEHELAAQRRRFRLRLALVLAGAVLLAVLAAVGTYAWTQRQTARSEALSAEALGLLAIDPEAALDTALAAVDTKSTDAAENALRTTVAQAHGRGAFGGPDDAIADLDVAADGRLLTRGPEALAIRSPTGEVTRTVRGLSDVEDAALCPGPERIVAATGKGTVVVARGTRARLRGAPEGAFVVECSRDGSTILVANDESAVVYSRALRPIARIDAEDLGIVETAALSPNGELVAVAGPDVTRIVRVSTGGTVATIGQALTAVAFSPDNSRLVGGSADGQLVIRGLSGPRDRIVLDGHTQAVSDVEVSSDGALVVTSGTDRAARIWDAVTGAEIAVLRGHTGALRAAAFGQGRTVVTAADDGTARFWEAPVTTVLAGHVDRITAVAVTPDGSRVATASFAEGSVRLWNARTGAQLARFDVPDVDFVAITPNGRRLLTRQTIDGRVRLWNAATPRRPLLIPVDGPNSATFTPDGRLVVTAGPGRTIRFFGLAGRAVRSFGAPSRLDEAGQLALSPRSERLAVAEDPEGQAMILDAVSGSELAALPEQELRVRSLSFSPDGDALATAEASGVARFWDGHEGSSEPPALAGHDGAVLAATFSPDSTLVATVGNDGTVRIWHVETGVELVRFPGASAAFASRAPVLVTAGPGTTARVLPCGPCGSVSELRERARDRQPSSGG